MEILREKEGFVLSQRQFTLNLLKEFDFSGSTVSSPLDPYSKLCADDEPLLSDTSLYMHLVGKLNYLTNTHLDLSLDVICLSQFIQRLCLSYFTAGLRVLCYLCADPSLSDPLFDLIAFCDDDWAACKDSRRSVSVFSIMLGGAPISWKSKKQAPISLSSTEAEYRSMRRVTAQITWLVRLLVDLSSLSSLPIPIHSDSQATIHISRNPVFHE
ncbi:secreted RxLR effector protein 161-like [Nicotiana tabacum]|uniref:Secreted RxLR effector protein 161-like n=1 Tax=Nicotiana tabacum TaxID=4097 RepID=A0AC58S360_TOBAC